MYIYECIYMISYIHIYVKICFDSMYRYSSLWCTETLSRRPTTWHLKLVKYLLLHKIETNVVVGLFGSIACLFGHVLRNEVNLITRWMRCVAPQLIDSRLILDLLFIIHPRFLENHWGHTFQYYVFRLHASEFQKLVYKEFAPKELDFHGRKSMMVSSHLVNSRAPAEPLGESHWREGSWHDGCFG